ncbi:unnamed protein product, partial [Effrenium voratum]
CWVSRLKLPHEHVLQSRDVRRREVVCFWVVFPCTCQCQRCEGKGAGAMPFARGASTGLMTRGSSRGTAKRSMRSMRSMQDSRPSSSHTEAFMRHLDEEEKQGDGDREKRAFATDKLHQTNLEARLGTFGKTGKILGEHIAAGGKYMKYRACRQMDDKASKALGAENIARIQAETSASSPSVRDPVLRITDEVELADQTASGGTDDLVTEIVGTSSASYMTAFLRWSELREDVKAHHTVKQANAQLNLNKVANHALFGHKRVLVKDQPPAGPSA